MRHSTRVAIPWLLATSILAGPSSSRAEETAEARDETPSASLFEPQRFEAECDQFFRDAMKENEINGAVVAVVGPGQAQILKGYGLADTVRGTPVDPQRTLFYIASTTKLFTVLSVLKLVDVGAVDLHKDVLAYLPGFRFQGDFAQPVTLHHLMTHTAGFDDRNIGYLARSPEAAQTLRDYLTRRMPPRIRPPGILTSYCNHSFALAGLVVEQVSGLSYQDYLEQRIFEPLHMTRSTAHVPPEPALLADLAVGYRWRHESDGEWRQVATPLWARNIPPAGSVSTTAADMARLMAAVLQGWSGAATPVLSAGSMQLLRTEQFTHHPALPGFSYGLWRHVDRGREALVIAGGFLGYTSVLVFVPQAQVGVFAAWNRMEMDGLSTLPDRVLEWTLPAGPESPAPETGRFGGTERFAGVYHWNRYGHRTIEKLALWDGQCTVAAVGPGRLRLACPHREPQDWVQVEPLVFRDPHQDRYLVFREGEGGAVDTLLMSLYGGGFPIAMERLPWYDAAPVQRRLLLGLLLLFVSAAVLWPLALGLGWGWRRWRGRPRLGTREARLARVPAIANAIVALVFVLGFNALIDDNFTELLFGMPTWGYALFCLPLLSTILSIVVVYVASVSWRRGTWSRLERVYHSLLAVGGLAYVAFLGHWNLLGFRF